MSKTVTIFIAYKTPLQAFQINAFAYVTALALMLPGWALGSSAMQWLGFFLFFVVVFARATRDGLTIEQARARLDEIEAADK